MDAQFLAIRLTTVHQIVFIEPVTREGLLWVPELSHSKEDPLSGSIQVSQMGLTLWTLRSPHLLVCTGKWRGNGASSPMNGFISRVTLGDRVMITLSLYKA